MQKQLSRIGFILANIHSGSAFSILPALVNEANQTDISIWMFPGGRLEAPDLDESLQNKIYKMVFLSVDGVVSWASSIGSFVENEKLTSFHNQFLRLPLVTMSHEIAGIPLVSIDAYRAMMPLLDHFYNHHGITEFAFLQGPAEHESAQDRLQAFRDFHYKNNLPLKEELISSPSDWSKGEQALEELIDERKLLPGKDFKALIASSDLQLYQAVRLLQKRGYAIPKDLLVGGFNDSLESQIAFPPFTTIHSPIKEQAVFAVRELLKCSRSKEKNVKKYLQGTLVIRRSCGCIPIGDHYQNGIKDFHSCVVKSTDLDEWFLTEARHCAQIMHAEPEELNGWINPLFEALKASVLTGSNEFVEVFESVLERQIRKEMDISVWQAIITRLLFVSEQCLIPELQANVRRHLDIARMLLSDALLRSHQLYQWKMDRQWIIIRNLEKDLINIQHRNELSSILFTHLVELGISRAYVVEMMSDGKAVCIAGFDRLGPLNLETAIACESGMFLPSPFLQSDPASVWVVEPLTASREFLGWACIRVGEPVATIYEEIRSALSKSVMSLRHIDRIQRAQADALKAEKLKSTFLANVSSELLTPLDTLMAQVGKLPKMKEGKMLNATIKKIEDQIKNQKSLLTTIIDLSRAEVGDFDFHNRFIALGALFRTVVQEKNGKPLICKFPSCFVPLVYGDNDKLLQAFQLLCNAASGTEVEILYEVQGITVLLQQFTRQNSKQFETNSLEYETAGLLVQKIIAGHGGIIELFQSGPNRTWKIRLPYPAIESPVQSIKSNKIYIIGGTQHFEILKPYLRIDGYEYTYIKPEALLECKSSQEMPGLLMVHIDTIDTDGAALLYTVFKNPLFRSVPLLLFPRSDESRYVWDTIFGCFNDNAATVQAEKTIVLYRLKKESSQILTKQLAHEMFLDLNVIEDKMALQNLYKVKHTIDLLVIQARPEVYEELTSMYEQTGQDIPVFVLCDAFLTNQLVEPLLDKERHIIVNEGIYSSEELQHMFRSILSGGHFLPAYTGKIVKKAVLYLNQHIKETILRWKLADYVHISEDYLSRIFKKELGLTPWDYIIRLRIHTSKKLLQETSEPISEIAEKVGFSDQAYFCRVFKKIVGVSPLTFRKGKD